MSRMGPNWENMAYSDFLSSARSREKDKITLWTKLPTFFLDFLVEVVDVEGLVGRDLHSCTLLQARQFFHSQNSFLLHARLVSPTFFRSVCRRSLWSMGAYLSCSRLRD